MAAAIRGHRRLVRYAAILGVSCLSSHAEAAPRTTRVSVGSFGVQANEETSDYSMSADGRFVAFASEAENLVSADRNGVSDVFLRDRSSGVTTRLSVAPFGAEGNGASWNPRISPDGGFVAFVSAATNLVNGDSNGADDVFVIELRTGGISRASTGPDGGEANGSNYDPKLSNGARRLVFRSMATNLVPGVASGPGAMILKELPDGATRLLYRGGLSFSGIGALALSADGRRLAYQSIAETQSNISLIDLDSGESFPVVVKLRDEPGWNLNGSPSISADGRFVAFTSVATDLLPESLRPANRVYVRDTLTRTTILVSVDSRGSHANAYCDWPSISPDGHVVAFASVADNLVSDDTNGVSDVFAHDRRTGITRRVNVDSAGRESSLPGHSASASNNGRYVSFMSSDPDLVPDDWNGAADVFVRDRGSLQFHAIAPDRGSERGGDVVHLYGEDLPTTFDAIVAFDDEEAEIVSVGANEIIVLAPRGFGSADVTIAGPGGAAIIERAYEFVEPAIAARFGNVNVGIGHREDVLRVNGSAGDARREVWAGVGEAIRIEMLSPSTLATAPFALYAWPVEPHEATLTEQPLGLGTAVLPMPLSGGSPAPVRVWNNFAAGGRRDRLGVPDRSSARAPSVVLDHASGSPEPLVLTLQGLVQDGGSFHPRSLSLTNAVVLRIGAADGAAR